VVAGEVAAVVGEDGDGDGGVLPRVPEQGLVNERSDVVVPGHDPFRWTGFFTINRRNLLSKQRTSLFR
jgi:hypothetical protein